MIKLVDLLREVGDATAKPYRSDLFTVSQDTKVYGFTTDKGTMYTVELVQSTDKNNILDVSFYPVDEEDPDKEDFTVNTNKGELYRVMSTVVDIVKKNLQKHPEIEELEFTPTSLTRSSLYISYIKHAFPQATVTNTEGNTLQVKIK
jgi:hypothetical protein